MERVLARAPRRRASVRRHLHAGPRTALRALALLLASALLNLTAVPAAKASPGARAYAGEVTVVGEVRVNGSLAASGETIFPGNVLATSEKSRGVVNLGPLGRVELSPRTSLSLDFGGAGTACALEGGRVRVYAPAASAASVKTADASVSSAGGATAAVFSVESVGGKTSVVVQSGQAEVRAGGSVHRLSAGETYTTEPEPEPRGMSDDKRKGLYVAIAGAVAVVLIVLAARDSGNDDQFSTCIDVISGESRCF